ncbi:MAG: UV DNA damage repair endonuclease UvsE [Ignisphaera sp.]|nr:UV DNA damage repair endonuclease UvsE [Ignisphaera sp.]MDW8085371.1 UV DNA damage repair endonuclease UvsE [Ignisphaera sp.]
MWRVYIAELKKLCLVVGRPPAASRGGTLSIGLGFFCSTSGNELSTNHSIRLHNLSRSSVVRAFQRNLRDFIELLKLSCRMGLAIFRLGSHFVPFASHPEFQPEWAREIENTLKHSANLVKSFGVRVTMHPAQYVVLNSPRQDVVERSLAELRYHFWILDTLGLGRESVVVIHIGGVYGDKSRALRRFEESLYQNRWLLKRLAIENDERYYTAQEVLEVAEALGIPFVFDYYHHTLNPSSFSVDRLISTWRGVVPEVHISSKPDRVARFGEHGDYVDIQDFKNLINIFNSGNPIDVVAEAKGKEKAISKLLKEIEREGMDSLIRKPMCSPESTTLVLERFENSL